MQAQAFRKSICPIRASTLKSQISIIRSFAVRTGQPVVLETTGTEFIAWRRHHSRKASITMRSAIEPLNTLSLMSALRQIEYIGEPIHVILHPPCVCVRAFQPKTENSEKWLASHLIEVAPPGNRRDLVMCYQTLPPNLIIVAFARRAFLKELIQLAQQSRSSLKGIYAGGSLAISSLTRQVDEYHQLSVDFSLCRYEVSREDETVQIFPRSILSGDSGSPSSPESGSSQSSPSVIAGQLPAVSTQSILLSAQRDTVDFAPQIGLPKIFSSDFVRKVLHAELIAILLLLAIILIQWEATLVCGNPVSNAEYRSMVSDLTELRQLNSLAAREVELATNLQRPRLNTCHFLKSVALATPPHVWLSSITFNTPTSGAVSVFALAGFSMNGDGPLQFVDSLRSVRDCQSVTLTKVNIVEHSLLDIGLKNRSDGLTRFEITGEYERKQ